MNNAVDFQAIVMAAGKGTRLCSERPKVLHEVLGKPMIAYAVRASLQAGARRVVVVLGHGREQVQAWLTEHLDQKMLADRVHFAVQDNQLGTAHAVYAAHEYFADAPEFSVIVSGDVPNMDAQTLSDFVSRTAHSGRPLGLMSAKLADPARYGRVLRDESGQVTGIVEYKDASEPQRRVNEINAGFYAVQTEFLARFLPEICEGPAENAQGEYYLTDLIELAAKNGGVYGSIVDELGLIQGVNTRQDLADATRFARRRINRKWMAEGVTFIDPDATYIEADVELSPDVILYPGVHLRGRTRIEQGTTVENGSVVCDSELGANVHIKPYCHLEEARVDAESAVGPFAHLRPGADLGKKCKVGNFVEIKKSRLDDGVKAGHLTYLGDSHVGEETNVGAGTITCNYDGKNKNRTEIGAGSFIGSNTALVAPVKLGKKAYIGAGSVITDEVPDESLAIGRGRQKNFDGWVRRKEEKSAE
jgi:bifunctional UDP-N-acetylglucosamine pyrophosphorylase/glucosamine-1-phosphate N-acetyltransferase